MTPNGDQFFAKIVVKKYGVRKRMAKLGDRVKDPVTGIEGIAYGMMTYLQGCDRIGIQQPAFKDKDGNTIVPDLFYVDEPQLLVIEEGVIERGSKVATGGPSKFLRDSKR